MWYSLNWEIILNFCKLVRKVISLSKGFHFKGLPNQIILKLVWLTSIREASKATHTSTWKESPSWLRSITRHFLSGIFFASDFFGLKNSRNDNQALLSNHWGFLFVFFFWNFYPCCLQPLKVKSRYFGYHLASWHLNKSSWKDWLLFRIFSLSFS